MIAYANHSCEGPEMATVQKALWPFQENKYPGIIPGKGGVHSGTPKLISPFPGMPVGHLICGLA